MTPTTKSESLTIEQAEQALAQAKADRDELRERLIAGDNDVTDQDVAEADDRVVFAELKVEAAQEADARRREHARRSRIGQIRSSLLDGHLADQAAALIDLSKQARTILDQLYQAAEQHNDEVRASFLELASLQPLPDDIDLPPHAGGGPPTSIVVDGVRVHLTSDLAAKIVVDAAYQVVTDHNAPQDICNGLARHAGQVGRPGNAAERMGATEYLAHQYRLNGHGGS